MPAQYTPTGRAARELFVNAVASADGSRNSPGTVRHLHLELQRQLERARGDVQIVLGSTQKLPGTVEQLAEVVHAHTERRSKVVVREEGRFLEPFEGRQPVAQ